MRAIVQEGYGSADVLHLREIAQPAVPDDGVLVRIRAASINAADYHFLHGMLPIRLMMGPEAVRYAEGGRARAKVVIRAGGP